MSCPDLFWRIEPGIDITHATKSEAEDGSESSELFGKFDKETGIEDLES